MNIRLNMLLARLPARLPEYRALPARFEAWLNLSQREKARLFVIVRVRAMAIKTKDLLAPILHLIHASSNSSDTYTYRSVAPYKYGGDNSPTSGSHMNLRRMMARMARATHRIGWL